MSKVGARRDDQGAWLPAETPAELTAGVEANLRTLGIERLHAVNLRLHDPDGGGDATLEERFGALEDLRREGKLAHIGISNANRATVERALELVDLACVQNAYSLLDRTHDDVLELCAERGIAFVPFFPLGSAFTGGPERLAATPAVAATAAKHEATPSQIALDWLLHRDDRILLIPGTSSTAHLEENLAAIDVSLDDEDLAALATVEEVGNALEQ